MTEQVEAVAEIGREDSGVEIGVGANAGPIPGDVPADEGLLDVGVKRPAVAD